MGNKRQGNRFENETARQLNHLLPGAEFESNWTGEAGRKDLGVDVGSPFVPLAIQVTKAKGPSPWKKIEEAKRGADPHELPVARVYRKQKKPGAGAEDRAVLDWDHFVSLLTYLHHHDPELLRRFARDVMDEVDSD